jgi:predicted permease
VVLSHAFWQDYFGGDDVTGRKVTIRGAPYEVIGVAPRGFRGIELEQVDVWLPLLARTEPGSRAPWYSAPFNDELRLIARLAAEATPAGAAREVTTIMRPFFTDLNREAGFTIHRDSLNASMAPITSKLGRGAEGTPESRVVDWLVAVGIILLLVAVSNVAGLLLLRSMGRGREVAIRSALGMTRGRLAALVLTETFILVVMGGVAGLALLLTAGRSLERMVFPGLAWEAAATLEPTRVAVVATGVLLAFVLAGLVALAHTPRDVAAVLKQGAQRAATRRSPAHRLILVAQTTLSFILLVGAALFVRSLRNLTSEDLGVDAHRTLAVHVDFAGTARSRAEIGAFYERARERVAAIPGIESTSLSLSAPLLRSARSGGSIRLPGVDSVIRMPGIGTIPMVNYVTPDFFETVGMSLQRGRTFEESEREHGLAVVVNRTMADVYWPGQEAVGECVQLNRQPACATVVGVVEPQRMFQIREEPHLLYYRPLPRTDAEIGNLLLRTSLSSARTAMTVRRALLDVDPGLPWADISELSTGLEAELRPWRLGVTVFTAFGGLAMLLAAIGLTSAIAYSVNERAREISVRVAVGARRWDVLLLVLREGLAIGVLGVGVGLAVALIAAPRLGDLLYKQAPHDVFVLGTVAVAVLAIAILAALAPAIRASRIDPMRVLTSD